MGEEKAAQRLYKYLGGTGGGYCLAMLGGAATAVAIYVFFDPEYDQRVPDLRPPWQKGPPTPPRPQYPDPRLKPFPVAY